MIKKTKTIIITIFCIILLIMLPVQLSIADPQVKQNWPQIIMQLEEANKKYPGEIQIIDSLANAYNNYALELANNNDWDQAEQYLRKALRASPNSQTIKDNLSATYVQHAFDLFENKKKIGYSSINHNEAKQLATQALDLNSKNSNAYIILGDIEYSNQRMSAAQKAWEKAALLNPNNTQVRQRLEKVSREAQTENTMETKYNMYFLIKTEPELENLVDFDINETLDTIRIHVSQDFNFVQKNKIPVIVYTRDSYRDTVVEAPEWSEGAFDGKIRIVLNKHKNNVAALKSTIVHEYTHAVIAEITGDNIPRWLNEGIAQYEELRHGIAPRINLLVLAYNANEIIPWENIDNTLISTDINQVLLAYQQSFCFVQYIVERYGIVKLTTLLKTLKTTPDFATAVKKIYQTPIEELEKDWRIWLADHIQLSNQL